MHRGYENTCFHVAFKLTSIVMRCQRGGLGSVSTLHTGLARFTLYSPVCLFVWKTMATVWWLMPIESYIGFEDNQMHLSTHTWITATNERLCCGYLINPLTAKLFNLNFHPLKFVSRWRDPQLQVSENYLDLTRWRSTVFKYCWLMSHFIFTMLKRWYLMC